jgi:hypothetical protein
MIYASSSVVINLSKQKAWNFLETCTQNIDKYWPEILCTATLESYYDGFLHEITMNNNKKFKERVFVLKEQFKIIMRLSEHPTYQGETILQLVGSDDDFLSDKKVTLTAVLSWRIHPGIIEVPMLHKDDFIAQLVCNIQSKANTELI